MDQNMTALIIITSFAIGLALLGIAADRWGLDSRPSIGDDHAR